VTLLNKTAGKLAIPVFWELMSHYPTPRTFSQGTSVVSDAQRPDRRQKPYPASPEFVQSLLQPLGLHVTRSKRLIDLSLAFLQDPPRSSQLRRSRSYQSLPFSSIPSSSPSSPLRATDTPSHPEPKRSRYPPTPISHLPGTGPYALDSYRIFCTPCEWKEVMPSDKELIRYLVSDSLL
jgi:methyl-CpG-binding domain protein 4